MQIRDQGASRHTHARARACTHSHRHAQAQARAHHNIRTLAAQTCAYPACARNHNARTQTPAARCRRVRADASAPGNSRQPQCEDSTRIPRAPPLPPPWEQALASNDKRNPLQEFLVLNNSLMFANASEACPPCHMLRTWPARPRERSRARARGVGRVRKGWKGRTG